ncbi:hypothetical protein CHS0354_024912 [Potamilus streckersoni]|uniref:Uncharacterized protein n=1 Tax=Potamilus streckersoni TaxID=2493646 RepID=A0AAE0VQ84_9BIVA|nr:hypothetical protein CHS0354_024912 [Potamilus streckersoni]
MEGIINYINYVALGCSALALILDIVALALPNWVSSSNINYGLWKFCSTISNRENNCMDLTNGIHGADLSGFIIATRALTIIGLLLLVAAIAMAVLKIFIIKDKLFLSLGAAASANAAGGLTLIGVIVFAVKTNESSVNADILGAGFRLAVVAGVIPIVAGIMFIIGKNK